MRRGTAKDRVHCRDDRDSQDPDEVEDMIAVIAAPDAVLVLNGDGVDAAVEREGGLDVVGALVLADAVPNIAGVCDLVATWMENRDLPASGGRGEVARERRDAAATRRIGSDECRSDDDDLPPAKKRGELAERRGRRRA
jgi:hypothetical protein